MQVKLTILADSPSELRQGLDQFMRDYGVVELMDAEQLSVEDLLARLQGALPGYTIDIKPPEKVPEPEPVTEEAPPPPSKAKKPAPKKTKTEPTQKEKIAAAAKEPKPKDDDHVPDTTTDPAKDMEKALDLLLQVYELPEGKTALQALRTKYGVTKFSILPVDKGPELLEDAVILANGFGLTA